jgi:hypothetical protein
MDGTPQGHASGGGIHVIQESIKPSVSAELYRLEDGYNWRKYGQKLVKGIGRSYFKCTHPDCSAKKKVYT